MLFPPSSWKLTVPICAVPEPLIVVSCSGPPSEFELTLYVTPPVRLRRPYKSRLTSGRFSTSFWPTVRVRADEAVSTSGESPTTDTVSLTAPSSIVASTLALRPTSSTMPVCEKFLNPGIVTLTW